MSESKISCPHCAQSISLDTAWSGQVLNCPSCQKPFTVPQLGPAAPPALRVDTPAPPPLPPLQTGAGSSHGTVGRSPAAARPVRVSGLAIASLVLSLFGWLFFTAIAGAICGHIARKQIRRDASLSGGGLALAGLAISYLMIALSVAFGVKFVIDVKHRVEEIRAQRSGRPFTNSTPHGVVGAKIRSSVPAPADPVSGTVRGEPFNYVRSGLAQGTRALEIDGREFATEGTLITIFLTGKPGESLENRTWHITPATPPNAAPSVFIIRMHGGTSTKDRIASGYEMDVTTGPVSGGVEVHTPGAPRRIGGTIAGTISLKINGSVPVDIKGNFAGPLN